MITPQDITAFENAIKSAETVFMSAHVGPDGDTLGSMLGLKHALIQNFPHLKRVDAAVSGKTPDLYHFLPGSEDVVDSDTASQLLETYDLSFCLDCGAADRLGASKPFFMNAKLSVNIDHHYTNERFGQLNIIDVDAGASGEVVADLLLGANIPIPPESATCLYVAVLTDTGGFKFSSTSPKIFELAATLTRQGANPEVLFRQVYDMLPKCQAMLHAHAMTQAEFNPENTLCWATIMQSDLKKFGAHDDHIEGLVDLLRRIEPVKIAVIFKETRLGHTKVSLRSDVHAINVSDIAARWGGGGHKMAAGCTIELPPATAKTQLLPTLEDTLKAASRR